MYFEAKLPPRLISFAENSMRKSTNIFHGFSDKCLVRVKVLKEFREQGMFHITVSSFINRFLMTKNVVCPLNYPNVECCPLAKNFH